MEITLTIKGATPAEVREALLKLYNEGQPGPVAEPQPAEVEEPEKEKDLVPLRKRYRKARTLHYYTPEEDAYIRELDERGVDRQGITRAFNTKFGTAISVPAIQRRIGRVRDV